MYYVIVDLQQNAYRVINCVRRARVRVYYANENHRYASRLPLVVVYGRKMYVYLGDDTRIVGKGGCFPLWTPLDVGIDYTPSDVSRGYEKRAR